MVEPRETEKNELPDEVVLSEDNVTQDDVGAGASDDLDDESRLKNVNKASEEPSENPDKPDNDDSPAENDSRTDDSALLSCNNHSDDPSEINTHPSVTPECSSSGTTITVENSSSNDNNVDLPQKDQVNCVEESPGDSAKINEVTSLDEAPISKDQEIKTNPAENSVNNTCKESSIKTEDTLESCDYNTDISEEVLNRSRYGRTHKPKPLIDGFLTTDKKVGAFLGHSPQSSPRKKEDNLRLSLRSHKKSSPIKLNPGETLIAALKSLRKRNEPIVSPATLPRVKKLRGRPRLSDGNNISNVQVVDSPSSLVSTNESLNDGSPLFTPTNDITFKKKRGRPRKAREIISATEVTVSVDTSLTTTKPIEDDVQQKEEEEKIEMAKVDDFKRETPEKEVIQISPKIERVDDDADGIAEKESDSGVESSATTPPSEPEDGAGSKEDNPLSRVIVPSSYGEWLVGDLVWGHIKGHPFWPCIIVHEPEQGIYIKSQNVGRNKMSHFHVRFFGDNARRSWIRCSQIIRFNGSKDYLKLMEEHPNRKKDFEVTAKNISKWKSAVKEAENLLPYTRSERLEKFTKKYADVLKETNKKEEEMEELQSTPKIAPKKGKKRRRVSSSSQSSSENDTPVKSGSIEKEKPKQRTYKVKRKKIQSEDPFDKFCEKHRDRLVDENPTLDKKGIQALLNERWKIMDEKVKQRYENARPGKDEKNSDDDFVLMEEDSVESGSFKEEPIEKVIPRKKARISVANVGIVVKRGGLFKGLKTDKVCIICEKPGGEGLKCKGQCLRFFHVKCAPEASKGTDGSEEFKCGDCVNGLTPPCYACWKKEGAEEKKDEERKRCNQHGCGRYYHEECLTSWPQAWYSRQTFTCPAHCCHTCASDDPRESRMHTALAEKLVRCIRCPATYHSGDFCLPAGCEVLTGSQIICQRHYKIPKKGAFHMNTSWCFICSMGGSLICCDRCPSSFHPQCLNITAPEGSYICEDCDSARYPLYGEVVWVKLGRYRWWPAQILYPSQIPENVQSLPHVLGEFAVRFFGSHDHYWVNNGRSFLYQQGDSAKKAVPKSGTDALFAKAMEEASEYYKKHAEKRAEWDAANVNGRKNSLKPPRFVRIKTNKPVGDVRPFETMHASDTPCDCDPKIEKPCSQEPNCLNRMLMVECDPNVCRAGDRCCNQRFQKRQYPPLRTFRTEGRGWGLQTMADLSHGDFVVEYVGEMINEAECHRRIERMHRLKDENYYFLTIDKDHILDAGPKGNLSRFMNHSCNPNCETQKWTVGEETRIGLFALCDIPAGTELTFNYNLQVIGTERRPCLCGAPNCVRFIGAKTKPDVEDIAVPATEESAKTPKRKKKLGRPSKLLSNVCHKCGHGGELIYCGIKNCGKGFHVSCTELTEEPTGKWSCPQHQCFICGEKPHIQCGECTNYFCHSHLPYKANGKVTVSCSQHVKSENTSSEGSIKEKVKEDSTREDKAEKNVMKENRASTPKQRPILRNKLAQQNES